MSQKISKEIYHCFSCNTNMKAIYSIYKGKYCCSICNSTNISKEYYNCYKLSIKEMSEK